MNRTLPTDSEARKAIPLFSGLLKYFPAALAGVARWSKIGNDKHNPGEPMHHARGKSTDHADCIPRHLVDIADLDAVNERNSVPPDAMAPDEFAAFQKLGRDILDEADALAWRALALSQQLHEKYGGAPLAPGATLPDVEAVDTLGERVDALTAASASIGLAEVGSFTKLTPRRPVHWRSHPLDRCACGDPTCGSLPDYPKPPEPV